MGNIHRDLQVLHSGGSIDRDTEAGVQLIRLALQLVVRGGFALAFNPSDDIIKFHDASNIVAFSQVGLDGVYSLLQCVAEVDLAGKSQTSSL